MVGPEHRYWHALGEGRLVLQRCEDCAATIHRPRMCCPHCGGPSLTVVDAAGEGTVYSVTTVRRPPPDFRDEAPFQVALVDLVEGARVMVRIVGAPVGIGAPVRVQPAATGGPVSARLDATAAAV